MKKILLALAAAAACGSATAQFSGPMAPVNWSVTNVGTLTGNVTLGTALFTLRQLVLVGADASLGCTGGTYGFAGPCELRVTVNQPGIYTFDYSYVSFDADGPGGDLFGVIVDGVRVAPSISDPGGAVSQAATRSFTAQSSFGFFLNCSDCTGGEATATITSFSVAAIPEPGTLALWLAGGAVLAGVAMRRRRRGG
jgi:hypothetical protein